MEELLTVSGMELGRRIKSGEITPMEAVEAHIQRIEAVNPTINAVIHTTYDEARRQAAEAGERIAEKGVDGLPPLFGVPCTIKETYAVKGLPWTGGVVARRDVIAEEDAALVSLLRKEGAIILGLTNVPEAAMWMETYNKIYGMTRNPYNPKHTVGGSSGGQGAIIAAGGAPFGLGSDVGGSIRYPTVFNGIVGHKPTGGLTDGAGNWPDMEGAVKRYCTFGPMARRMEDVIHMMKLFTSDGGEPRMADPLSVKLSDLNIFHYGDLGSILARSNADVKSAVSQAAEALEERCAEVTAWRPEGMKDGLMAWVAMMSLEQETPFGTILGNGKPIGVGKEFFKFLIRHSNITGPGLALAISDSLMKNVTFGLDKGARTGRELQARIEEKLGDDGVMICPVYGRAAPRHHMPWVHFFSMGYSAPFNVMEFPCSIVPIFRNSKGLPVGLQIVGGRGMDHLTLAVALELEKIFGGWTPPD